MGGAVGAAAQETAEGALGDRPVDVGGATAVGGLLGGALGGIGAAAGAVKNAIRDPAEQMGRDIASAEKIGGGTAFWKGTKKGPAYEAAEDVARAETVAGAPISPSGVAARKAVPELGKAVQGDIDARLGAMGAENAAGGEELVSLQPVVAKAMKRLQGMTRDQKALPGMTTRDLAQTVRQSANVRVVDYADETLNHVDPENLIEAGAAKAMGLIRDQDVSGKFVVLEPRSVTPRELEDIRRSFDATGKITPSSKRVVGEAANAREMAGAAREARKQLGPEAVERASRHEQSLGEMENAINAARLPPGTRKVDLNDLATRKQLASGVGGYRARGNEASGADKVLDQLAGSGPLRGALDESAGVAAMERLRREGGASKLGSGPAYGLLDAQKLRADALARFLDDKVGATARPVGRGLIPFAAGASTGRKRQ
jgi:hypothetical protein